MESPAEPFTLMRTMELRAFLAIAQGPDKGQIIPLESEAVRIGRDPNCQVHLSDAQVSRKHVKVYRSASGWNVVDLNSSNGTLVNGEQITLHELSDGDLVIIGETMIGFHLTEDPVKLEAGGTIFSDTQTITVDERQLYSYWEQQKKPEELARARTDLEALYRAGRIINSSLKTTELFPSLLDVLFSEMERIDRCSLQLVDPECGKLVQQAAKIRGETGLTDRSILFSQTMAAQAMNDGNALLTYDATKDQRFADGDSVQIQGIRSALCAPILAGEKQLGVLFADSVDPGNRFTVDDLRFLAAIALQAGTAIENALLYERLASDTAALHVAHQKLQSAQDQLVQSEKLAAVGQLASGIVHDMKNPMAVIMGYAGLIKDRVAEAGDRLDESLGVQRLANEIEGGVRHVNEVIEQLLLFAKPSSPCAEPTDIQDLIRETLRFLLHETNTAGVKIDDALPDALPGITIDANQIKQVLMNIILNATQAMPPGRNGILRVSGAAVNEDGAERVEIELSDNGCGMTEEQRNKIFEPFYTTKESGDGLGGSGLGLSVSYGIIQSHGGTIRVTSQPGEGSTFTISLPVAGDSPSR